ncbi:MAG: 2-hydroxycyclohexanecarboxyl-CoA dehydrogenase [Acidobacteria bacterium]|nr:MAG: 2-hydroxycyclohexanecarboxyl-CoA dehydrogenase [Acidobacteriota bacterium]
MKPYAIVTGGAGGIGKAISGRLVDDGFDVLIADLAREAAEAVATELGEGCAAIEIDVSSPISIARAFEEVIGERSAPAVLVNNAGWDLTMPFVESDLEFRQKVLAVNLSGAIECSWHASRAMLEAESGTIINVASDAGRVGSTGEVVYSGAKGGVIAFTKALAREVAPAVRVNCVCPGPTDTPLLGAIAEENPALVRALERAIPLRRIGAPADVAGVVSFLCSDDAAYMTGQTISVSGGLTMA